jgi:uncharacterized protein (TIGR02996 family)
VKSTTRAEWHARIEAAPADLDLRLSYADWLLEQGDLEGEVILLEVRALREPDGPEAERWLRRAKALRKELGGVLARYPARGGLIEHAEAGSAEQFEELFERAPALSSLEVVETKDVTASPRHPLWARPRRIRAAGARAARIVSVLADVDLPRLEELAIDGASADVAVEIAKILRRRCLHLTRFRLTNTQGDVSPAIIELSRRQEPFSALNLSGAEISTEAFAELLAGIVLFGIGELSLGQTGLAASQVRALGESHRLAHVERLDLRRLALGARGQDVPGAIRAVALGASNVISLELMGARLGVEGVLALTSEKLPSLRELSLQNCAIGDAGLEVLLKSPLSAQLGALNLRSNDLTDDAAFLLARANVPELRLLNLESNSLGETSLQQIARFPSLENAPTITVGWAGPVQANADEHNPKHGVWLGSTNYRPSNVLRRPTR